MSFRKPILVTGHRGYLGSVMAPYLVERGYQVVGLDTGYFDDCSFTSDPVTVPTIRKDVRDLVPADLHGVYAVIHLAALSNDPIGNLEEDWTRQINLEASVRLAELARHARVRRFLFSSSCIMYGMSSADVVDETTELAPRTTYARSKAEAEASIRELATDDFSPVFIRNGTVYGPSPRMRFDTVLNDLVAQAFTAGEVRVHSDGTPWRPVVHVEDIARTFELFLEAPTAIVHNQAFNNGAEQLNHQVMELARFAIEAVPGSDLHVEQRPGADQRTYRADFGKFARAFPDFAFRWDARAGALDLAKAFTRQGLTREQYEGDRFVRLRWLERLLLDGRLDDELRWVAA